MPQPKSERTQHPIRRIGIVTVTYNSASVLKEFLDSVWKQTHNNFILYIVDSASTDSTRACLQGISDVRSRVILCESNIGFAAGTNLGMYMAVQEGCDGVMLLNNDTVFGPDLFQELSNGLDAHCCDMTTPEMLYYDAPNKIWAAGGHLNRWLGYRNHHDGENQPDDSRFDLAHRVTFTPFCCILMRGSVIQTLGYLDEKYFVYTEDADYCYRALKENLSIWYLPQCRLFHKVSSLTGHMSDFMVRYCTRNRIYYLRKHLPRARALLWYAIYQVHYAVAFLLRKTSHEHWRLRRTSANEGWRM